MDDQIIFAKEYWTGDSRDGALVNGDGYHYFRMSKKKGTIVEAYELYENDDGEEIATPLPEMKNVSWIDDLGFDDFEALDEIEEFEFIRVKEMIESMTE